MHLLVLYLLGCLLIAFGGRRRRVGSIGFFLLAVFLTPILGALILLISAPGPQAPPH
jgi:hypothetical protein